MSFWPPQNVLGHANYTYLTIKYLPIDKDINSLKTILKYAILSRTVVRMSRLNDAVFHRVARGLCLTSVVITSHTRQAIRSHGYIIKMTSGIMFVCLTDCSAFKRLTTSSQGPAHHRFIWLVQYFKRHREIVGVSIIGIIGNEGPKNNICTWCLFSTCLFS